ncbi:hypothetical protein ACE41H_12985 [Paenibacillus enshidis]|uniref:Uncharacterized protein n=1 Tax=Paenibacillus enshidis TaxID=1458439 RepID=A0ABV5ATZ5_9BACL
MDLEKLKKLLLDYSRDPGRIIWGEVFQLFHLAKKFTQPLYDLDPAGDIIYDPARRLFIVRALEVHIHLKDYELVDAVLYQGRFRPKK